MRISEAAADFYWQSIPIGEKNAVTYEALMAKWGKKRRTVRMILQELSTHYEAYDGYVLIRSGMHHGFFRTDNKKEIERYKREILHKGESILAILRKCDNVLNKSEGQMSFF
jgi:hypothetical protein